MSTVLWANVLVDRMVHATSRIGSVRHADALQRSLARRWKAHVRPSRDTDQRSVMPGMR